MTTPEDRVELHLAPGGRMVLDLALLWPRYKNLLRHALGTTQFPVQNATPYTLRVEINAQGIVLMGPPLLEAPNKSPAPPPWWTGGKL